MKLLVIGASQGTGRLLTQQALLAGHAVTAVARSAQQLSLHAARLTKLTGDFHDAASMDQAVPGHDTVIITASLSMLQLMRTPAFYSTGTAHVIESMKRHGVPKIIILSNLAAGDGMQLLNPLEKLFTRVFIRAATADHSRQEQLARESGLVWTVVRPSRLTNRPACGQYQVHSGQRVPSSISRADVAAFLLETATSPRWNNQTLNVGG